LGKGAGTKCNHYHFNWLMQLLELCKNSAYLATNWTYRWSSENCRYGLDMGSFQLSDKSRIIADRDTQSLPLFALRLPISSPSSYPFGHLFITVNASQSSPGVALLQVLGRTQITPGDILWRLRKELGVTRARSPQSAVNPTAANRGQKRYFGVY
jgi:hypothetical protein